MERTQSTHAVKRVGSYAVLLCFALFTSLQTALANGDLFFEATEVPGKPEYVIFGSVKDDRGGYIEGAVVTVSVKEPFLSYTSESGLLGRFRTLDIGRAIKGLGYEVDPFGIEVTVTYPGYEVVRKVKRGKYGQKQGLIEVNIVMAKKAK